MMYQLIVIVGSFCLPGQLSIECAEQINAGHPAKDFITCEEAARKYHKGDEWQYKGKTYRVIYARCDAVPQ